MKKITYKVLKGEGQTFEISDNEKLTFRLNIEYSKFKEDGKAYIDGKLVDSKNYTSKEGSTIITFKENYAKELSAGEHTLKVAVADGEVSTTFKVANNTKKANTTVNTTTNNPQTGDNIIVYIALLLSSIIGLTIVKMKAKKKIK